MSLSLGLRVVHLWGKRHVCKLWSANCAPVPWKFARGENVRPLDSLDVGSMCRVADCRFFSSESHDICMESERNKLKNDPEIKAWMSQIAQDFETAPFQALVQDQRQTPHAIDTDSDTDRKSSTSEQDTSGTELEVEEFGYIEDDEDEFLDPIPEKSWPVSLQRGEHGVFDVEEIVAVLEDENGVDIQVLDIPLEARFVDHMVIVSGKSTRHMRAMAASIEWLYKRKKMRKDRHFKLEGKECKDWFAMDLGNIAVHIFTQEARQHYDLETLWTLGPEHDDQRHYVHDDSLNLSAADLFWLESGSSETPPSQTAGSVETGTSDDSEGRSHHRLKTDSDDVARHKDRTDSTKLQEKEKIWKSD